MSDTTEVPFKNTRDEQRDQAVLLLAAAEELGLQPDVVQVKEGAFVVPNEVNDQAFGERKSTKKAAAKKSTAKKASPSRNEE
jgi:hypothetical protein